MDLTSSQEPIKFSKDLYKSLTPVKRKQFSESMAKRRIPFLQNENTENEYKLIIKKSKSKENSYKPKTPLATIDNKINIKANDNKTTIKKDSETDVENQNWLRLQEDIRRLKGKHKLYLKSPKKELGTTGNETAKSLNETQNASDLTESSDYYSNDSVKDLSTSLTHETSQEISFKHLEESIKPLTNSTFIIQNETSGNETQDFQTASSISQEVFNKEKCNIKKENEKQNGIETQKPTNQIPLIKINETEIVGNTIKTPEKEKNHMKFKNFKHKHKDYQEVLREIAIKKKLYKQIAIKDRVMDQLLEMALRLDFPKLKHFCRKECERNEEGLCKKQMKIETEKESEESAGLLHSIWSVIKYPFVANPNNEEKENDNALTVVVKEKEEEGKQEDNLGKMKSQEGEQSENKREQETKHEKQNPKTTEMVRKITEIEPDSKVKQVVKILEEKEKKKDITKDLKENDSKEKDKTKDTSPKIAANSKETEKETKTLEEKEQQDSNKDLKTEKSPKPKAEPSKISPQKETKKSKPKKRFLFFFQRSDSAKEEEDESNKTENKIENMEDVFEELEKAEKKISEEALKKLDSFITEKKLPGTERKSRTKRSDSF